MTITASAVKELRQRTGAGMMDCKKALTEAGGDMEEAVKILRTKGLAAAAKKAHRAASEGMVAVAGDARKAAMIELNCETDFVARSDDFARLVEKLLDELLASGASEVEEFLSRELSDGSGRKVESLVTDFVAVSGAARWDYGLTPQNEKWFIKR